VSIEEISKRARIAEPGEAISAEELALAARNHGMPLEALRHDLTPVGLHYVLVHYDIPQIDASAWRLRVGGLVERDLELDLPALQRLPRRTDRSASRGSSRQSVLPNGPAYRLLTSLSQPSSTRPPSRLCSPVPIMGSNVEWSRIINEVFRWRTRWLRMSSSPTR
jgi:hypothetical protein